MAIKLTHTVAAVGQPVQQSHAKRLARLGPLMVEGVGRSPATSTDARVHSVAPVTSEQRQQLFDRLFSALARLEAKPESPRKHQQLGQLAQERTLLSSPLLKLVRLEVNQQSIVSFTDRALTPGDSVRVYQNQNRLWQLARPPASPVGTSKSQAHPVSLERGASLAMQNQQDTKALQALLAQSLRRALPLKDKPDLGPALLQIQQLPRRQQRELFSSELQQALHRAARQLRQPMQLTDVKGLRQALTEGGAQLENKLARVIHLGRALDPQARTGPPGAESSVSRVLSGDWKASLLTVLHQLRADLSRVGQTPDSRPGSVELSLSQLLTQASTHPTAPLSERNQRIQLLQLLHQNTLHSLARVQRQQLHGLSHQQAQADTGQATQSLALEVPMRVGQEVQFLHLRIDEQWPEEQEGAQGAARKTRQWQVLLSFELSETGPLHAQVTVRDQQVATRLWAERPDTAQSIRAGLTGLQKRLEQDGIEVTALECHLGAPAQRETRIHYSLVDVET